MTKYLIIPLLLFSICSSQTIHESKFNRTASILLNETELVNLYHHIVANGYKNNSNLPIDFFLEHKMDSWLRCILNDSQLSPNDIMSFENWSLKKAITISNLDNSLEHDFGIILVESFLDCETKDCGTFSGPTYILFFSSDIGYKVQFKSLIANSEKEETWNWFLNYAALKDESTLTQ